MKLRELTEAELETTVGGCFFTVSEFGNPTVVNLCGSAAFGNVNSTLVQPAVKEVARDAATNYLQNYEPPIPSRTLGFELSVTRLNPAEINFVYSHSRYMDGHEIRSGDPYDRWP